MAFSIGPERREDMSTTLEEMARHAFSHRFPQCGEPELSYHFDPGGLQFTDEDGQLCTTPAGWLLMAEGTEREEPPE